MNDIEVIPVIVPNVDASALHKSMPERKLFRTLNQARQAPDHLASALAVLDSLANKESTYVKALEKPDRTVLRQLYFGFLIKGPRPVICDLIMVFGSQKSVCPPDRTSVIVTANLSQWIDLLNSDDRRSNGVGAEFVYKQIKADFCAMGLFKLFKDNRYD